MAVQVQATQETSGGDGAAGDGGSVRAEYGVIDAAMSTACHGAAPHFSPTPLANSSVVDMPPTASLHGGHRESHGYFARPMAQCTLDAVPRVRQHSNTALLLDWAVSSATLDSVFVRICRQAGVVVEAGPEV